MTRVRRVLAAAAFFVIGVSVTGVLGARTWNFWVQLAVMGALVTTFLVLIPADFYTRYDPLRRRPR